MSKHWNPACARPLDARRISCALITPRCGENAEKVLSGAKIKVYRSADGTAQENLDALIAGKLSPLSEFHAGFHGHGG